MAAPLASGSGASYQPRSPRLTGLWVQLLSRQPIAMVALRKSLSRTPVQADAARWSKGAEVKLCLMLCGLY